MNDERVVEEIVTKFFLNTCRLRSKLNRHAVHAAVLCGLRAIRHLGLDDDAETGLIPLTTGSVAEFCIKPMLPHVGDIDIMFHRSTELAIPAGHIHHRHSYQMSFTTMSRYLRLLTVTYLATCT